MNQVANTKKCAGNVMANVGTFINTQLPFYERVVLVGICDKNSLISRQCTCVIPYQRTYENRNTFIKQTGILEVKVLFGQ